MKQQNPQMKKDLEKLARLGLQKEIINYLAWMKLKQEIALKRSH